MGSENNSNNEFMDMDPFTPAQNNDFAKRILLF